jgi:succinoglycan biosynthesis protein ExoM
VSAAVDISVCIATYRRPAGLARLLESLERQKLPEGVTVEIWVVDNDPHSSASGPPGVGWLREPRTNIAHARNRALDEARGAWIAFVDDDEIADEGWLAAYWAVARAGDADGFIGPVVPEAEGEAAAWIDVERFFSRPRHPTGTLVERAELRTSNAFLRRALFRDRRFDPAYGRSGGSDSELFGRMLDGGARFVFCDEAVVRELVPAQRRTLRWLSRRAFRGGAVSTRIARTRGATSAPRAALRAAAAGLALAGVLPLAALGGRARALRAWQRLCIQAGHLWSLAGGRFEEYRG